MGYETQTMKGVRGLTNALLIFTIAGLLSILLGYVAVAMLGALFTPGGGVSSGAVAGAVGAVALSCGMILLMLAGIIIALIGLWSMHKGRAEYGLAHEEDIKKTTILLVAAVVVFFFDLVVGIAVALSQIDFSNPSEVTYQPSPVGDAVSGASGIIFALLTALILYYLVKSFIPPEKVNLAIMAIGLFVVGPVITLVGSLTLAPPKDYFLHPDTVPFDPIWIVPSVIAGIISFIALLLFFLLYRDVQARLRNRTIKPVWETQAAAPAYQAQELRWQPPPKT